MIVITEPDRRMRQLEQVAVRRDFPAPGLEAAVILQIFNSAITVGDADGWTGYSQRYDFPTRTGALLALMAWHDPNKEPEGWIRHIPSNRRREGGDPQREYIRP